MINIKDLIKNKNTPINIIIIVVGLILAKNLYQGQLRKIDSLKFEIKDIGERSILIENSKLIEDKIDTYRKKYARKDASFYFDKLNEFIYDSGLEVIKFEPKSEEDKGVYSCLPYRLSINGNYHQLGKFLSLLESSKDIFKIEELGIFSSQGYYPGDKMSVNLTVVALYLK